jgi:hypothetical protein
MNTNKKLFVSLAFCGAVMNAFPVSAVAGGSKMVSVTLPAVRKPPIRYEGSLSDKHILLVLSQRNMQYDGAYAYVKPEKQDSPRWIDLSGSANKNGVISLTEKVDRKVTGTFSGKITGHVFSGTWRSPDGRSLSFSAAAAGPTDSLKIVARVEVTVEHKRLRGIDIYSGEKLTQSLPANASIFMLLEDLHYQPRDLNFDGYPDLSLPVENGDQLHWLFDPNQNRYVAAPASLQKVTVTAVEYSTREIFEEWDHGAEAKGMDIYRFVGGKYCLIEENKVLGEPETAKATTKKYPVSQCKAKDD